MPYERCRACFGAAGQVPLNLTRNRLACQDRKDPDLQKSPFDSAQGEGLQRAKREKAACRSVPRTYEPLGSNLLRDGDNLAVLIRQSAALNQAVDGAM